MVCSITFYMLILLQIVAKVLCYHKSSLLRWKTKRKEKLKENLKITTLQEKEQYSCYNPLKYLIFGLMAPLFLFPREDMIS